ncbi:methyltransferase, type 11 [Desulfosarcina variabilis str. Montpellier]|uniref:class I SAM-dependent methyltransferase n=1 Tax=Desulfosarcina variabilis TaxID=2300 RepID=UPI003AFAF6FA
MRESIILPEEVSKKIESGEPVELELGCGNRKRHFNAIGIDIIAYDGVDIVGDIFSALVKFPEQSIETVYAYHCFEHLKNLSGVMDQLARITKPKGFLHVEVPHFSNPFYYSDYSHCQPFGLYTFSYLSSERLFQRRCPTYQRNIDFELQRVKLVFKSPRPFYGRYAIKKMFQIIFNCNRYAMEFYEENLCWMIPCYEICYDLRRL